MVHPGLVFARLKNPRQEKPSPEKNSRQILAKNSRYRSHLNISAKKLKVFCHGYIHVVNWRLLAKKLYGSEKKTQCNGVR